MTRTLEAAIAKLATLPTLPATWERSFPDSIGKR